MSSSGMIARFAIFCSLLTCGVAVYANVVIMQNNAKLEQMREEFQQERIARLIDSFEIQSESFYDEYAPYASDYFPDFTDVVVEDGETVWGYVKAQIMRNYPGMSDELYERWTVEFTDQLQQQVDRLPWGGVTDINVVPVGWTFGMTDDNRVVPPYV